MSPPFDPPEDLGLLLKPIGVIASPFKVHAGTPRQPLTGNVQDGEIHLRRGLQNALKDLKGFSHLWVLGWFNYSRGWNSQMIPPRDVIKRGVFATRAPHRPNPLSLSLFQLLEVRGLVLRIRGVDLLNGTYVFDLKPYLPYADQPVGEVRTGWVAEIEGLGRPDHRDTRIG